MKPTQTLFDRMDSWRHLPNYQLERRADLFFSLYLSEVLNAKLGFHVKDQIIPEFPVRIGTIYPDIPIDKSYKIDYVLLSADSDKAILVELKTEGLSRRENKTNTFLHLVRQALLSWFLVLSTFSGRLIPKENIMPYLYSWNQWALYESLLK